VNPLSTFFALVCILFACLVEIYEEKILFDSPSWLLAAIAFALLKLPGLPGMTREQSSS
jgi:hypothetical protein